MNTANHDVPIPQLAEFFDTSYRQETILAGGGFNLLPADKQRYAFGISCYAGTRAYNYPVLGVPPTLLGISVYFGLNPQSEGGILIDDTLPPLHLDFRTAGFLVTDQINLYSAMPEMRVYVYEVKYKPNP